MKKQNNVEGPVAAATRLGSGTNAAVSLFNQIFTKMPPWLHAYVYMYILGYSRYLEHLFIFVHIFAKVNILHSFFSIVG